MYKISSNPNTNANKFCENNHKIENTEDLERWPFILLLKNSSCQSHLRNLESSSSDLEMRTMRQTRRGMAERVGGKWIGFCEFGGKRERDGFKES